MYRCLCTACGNVYNCLHTTTTDTMLIYTTRHTHTGGANKRAAKDKKYGHGGVPGRLKKQAKSKSINDMRGFNPKQGKTGAKKVRLT
jgi:Eukaryotic rRNA processing protein EBP2